MSIYENSWQVLSNGSRIRCSAKIAGTASIGSNATIWNNVVIGDNTRIGYNAFIWSNVNINNHVRIGDNANIGHSVEIGNNVMIGNNVHIQQGAVIGDNVKIGNSAKIAYGVIIPDGTQIYALSLALITANYAGERDGEYLFRLGHKICSLSWFIDQEKNFKENSDYDDSDWVWDWYRAKIAKDEYRLYLRFLKNEAKRLNLTLRKTK